jgi:CRP-like cAMP-binding protein
MESLLDAIKDDQEFYDKMSKRIELKQYKKGTLLQKKGDTIGHLYFVKKGILRSFCLDEKGKEHNFMFASEGWLMSDIESQSHNAPSELYIDVLEDCEVEVLNQSTAEELFNSKKLIDHLGNQRLLRRLGVLQRRVIMLMSASALERYNHFLETYPDLVQRIPQKMIASYLGITPEGLSKIRHVKARG